MASQQVQFALGQFNPGMPYTGQMASLLDAALSGGVATAQFFQFQYGVFQFYKWLQANASTAWTSSTDPSGNPIQVAQNQDYCLTLQPLLNQSVINQQTQPSQFQWNGSTYNTVGSMTATLSYSQSPAWYVEVPLGVAEMYPIAQLAGLVWSQLLQPLLSGFLSGVQSCFGSASAVVGEADAVAAGADAAEEAAVEGVAVADVEVSMVAGPLALAGLVVLIAIPFIVSFILHPSYHNLRVYNLTPYDIIWTPYVQEGDMSAAPTTGASETAFNYLIPAMSSWAPPGDTPVPIANEADFSFASGSEWHGLGYCMGFNLSQAGGPVVLEAGIAFDVPWAGDNSLFASWGPIGDPGHYYSSMEGAHKDHSMQVSTNSPAGPIQLTVTYDYLDDEHSTPGGGKTYFYNSLAVFSMANG